MSMQTAASRFIVPPIAKSIRLYQQLLEGVHNYNKIGNSIIQFAEQMRAFRDEDTLSELSLILSTSPLEPYHIIGQYYLALALCRNGLGDLKQSTYIFERVANIGPSKYKAEALISLSAISWVNNKPEETIRYCLEAIKVGDFTTTLQALRGIAVLKGREGYHRSALRDFEKIYPLIQHTQPHIYFDYLNSLAFELGEAGRKYEARNIIKRVLASPFAFAYPEWRQTAEGLKSSSRSFAVIDPTVNMPRNILFMPVTERSIAKNPAEPNEVARVLNMQSWKERRGKKDSSDKQRPAKELDERDRFFRIMEIYGSDKISDEQRYKMWMAVEKIASEPVNTDKPE
jgi:tetratricopeptide (TPR) repeat protein